MVLGSLHCGKVSPDSSDLTYIHMRIGMHNKRKASLYVLLLSFVFLQMCWWGINYLPSAQGSSIHTYNMN